MRGGLNGKLCVCVDVHVCGLEARECVCVCVYLCVIWTYTSKHT